MIKSDLRLLQLECAELYFHEKNAEQAIPLLAQAVVDKDNSYLKKRVKYLTERCLTLETNPDIHNACQIGITPLQFELLQTYKELHILKKYFLYSGGSEEWISLQNS